MRRTVFIVNCVEEQILNLYGKTQWATGVLIGLSTLNREYIVHLALTPCLQSGNRSDEFDEEWFVQHCCQINCMLTGGLKIMGIFVFGPPDVRNKLQVKFRQTLFAVQKALCGDIPLAKYRIDGPDDKNRVLICVCSTTRTTTCFTIDVSDSKASVQPSDLKYQNFLSKWIPLHCCISLKSNVILQQRTVVKMNYSNLKKSLSPILCNIANSLATVNGELLNDQHLLVSQSQKRAEENITRSIELYLNEEDFEPSIQKCMYRRAYLVGMLESYGCVPPKTTVKDAIDVMKADLIRSLLSRCRMLCEDMDDKNDEEDAAFRQNCIKWEMPKRIFVTICEGQIKICDYFFKDEDMKDVSGRISELMSVCVKEEDIFHNELFATADIVCEDSLVNCNVEDEDNGSSTLTSSDGVTFYKYIGVIGCLGAILTAVIFRGYSSE